ncbi:hypothetical protein [Burkholderia sp. LMU1-1-1.1]|uniref:hypothetical protein n=1 Tax=Burkholderia sp. LMU1-1-1.1 TaxID=3135266 RepID=UPI003418C632
MDEQIVEIDKRLTAVEKDVATLKAEAAFAREHFVTNQDFARLEERVASIQANYATKDALTALEANILCKLSQSETRMVRWCVGSMITLTGVFMAFVRFAL